MQRVVQSVTCCVSSSSIAQEGAGFDAFCRRLPGRPDDQSSRPTNRPTCHARAMTQFPQSSSFTRSLSVCLSSILLRNPSASAFGGPRIFLLLLRPLFSLRSDLGRSRWMTDKPTSAGVRSASFLPCALHSKTAWKGRKGEDGREITSRPSLSVAATRGWPESVFNVFQCCWSICI